MVCDKCEKKLGKVITPDPWKTGARNTTEGGGRKLNENKALTSAKNRFNPYTPKFEGCRICKQKVHQNGSYYCELKRKRFLNIKTEFYRILKFEFFKFTGQPCAYKKGICSMCGKKIIDT